MTSDTEPAMPAPDRWKRRRPTLDEQTAAKGTRPIGDGSFYVREDAFPEPGELEEFLEYVREGRRLGTIPGEPRSPRHGRRVDPHP